jgi:23S rRNA (cytosine1962-C5)-methyltransferase
MNELSESRVTRMLCPELPSGAVVHLDDDLIVVDKPPFVQSQAIDPAHDDDLPARVRRHLAQLRGVPVEAVYLGTHQRLDRDTSGLVLYTLRREANAAIAQQFEARSLEKTYLACVTAARGSTAFSSNKERTLSHELERARDGLMRVVPKPSRSSKRAVTRVRLLENRAGRMLVKLGCDTGRTHQLRVQLAHEGTPIAGDAWYGGSRAYRLLLHAAELRLRHPRDGRELVLRAPVPIEIERFMAHGYEPASIDPAFLSRALELAMHARYRLLRERGAAQPTNAHRFFNHEGDGDAELAVDLCGDHFVAQLYGAAIEAREAVVVGALAKLELAGGQRCAGVYVKRHPVQKSTITDPKDERFAPPAPLAGVPADAPLVIHEHGLPLELRLDEGLRTGLFLDQRDNRARVRALSEGKRVLNLFAYTGGFSAAALLGGASQATCVDVSATALAWAARNTARIGASARHRTLRSDVLEALQRFERKHERFDVIVLDPPTFSTTRSGRLEVKRDYARLVAAALAVLERRGALLACVNHHALDARWLREQLTAGAALAGRAISHIEPLPPPADFRCATEQAAPSTCALLTCA